MDIKTKFKIGDLVVYDGRYLFKIGGIVIYKDCICYFEDYGFTEEDNYEEKKLKLYKEFDNEQE